MPDPLEVSTSETTLLASVGEIIDLTAVDAQPGLWVLLDRNGALVRIHVRTSDAPLHAECADIPVRLLAPGQAQQLHLDLIADRQHWCMRATTADGSTPSGPLAAFFTARNANGSTSMGGVPGGTGSAWAARFDLSPIRPTDPIDLTAWVAGEKYVTAQAHVTVQP